MTPEELDEARGKEAVREADEADRYFTHFEIVTLAARLAREGWTPPELEPVVDPDILAFREWLMEREPDMREPSYEYDADFWDNCMFAQAFLAGARMATERERERVGPLLDYVKERAHYPDGVGGRALNVLANYRGEA